MLLDPIHAIISPAFYRRVAAQAWWRSVLYLGYVSILLGLAATLALKIHAGPHIDATFTWLEKSAPVLTYAEGKLSSNLTEPTILTHPEFPEIAIMIDTAKVDAVTTANLAEKKVRAYLTQNAFYMLDPQNPGQMKVYDLSKPQDPKPVTIDANFYQQARVIFNRVLYPVVFLSCLLFLLFWNAAWTLIYALIGLLLNGLAEGGLAFGTLAAIALYAQTAASAVQGLSLIAGFGIPKWPLVSLVLTGTYIFLAIKKLREPEPPVAV